MKYARITPILILYLLPFITCAQKNPKDLQIDWKTNTEKHMVPLEEFTILLEPDDIPSIENPLFWNKEQAMHNLFEHEPVIAVEINGEARAYPLSILTYHEIVNDYVGGNRITVTYCPLCNASIVFDRRITWKEQTYILDFGVSGMLRKSDLVMYDRHTQSWWQQFTGEAMVGELAGAQLSPIPSMLISLAEFYHSFPGGVVLSTETGHDWKYGINPYTDYDNLENSKPRLFEGEVDKRLPAMERVIDVHVNGKYKIYPLSVISERKVVHDVFQEESIVIFYTSKTVSVLDEEEIAKSRQVGSVTVFNPIVNGQMLTFKQSILGFIDEETGSEWNIAGKCISGEFKGYELPKVPHGNHFAFAWFAFHPETEIFTK